MRAAFVLALVVALAVVMSGCSAKKDSTSSSCHGANTGTSNDAIQPGEEICGDTSTLNCATATGSARDPGCDGPTTSVDPSDPSTSVDGNATDENATTPGTLRIGGDEARVVFPFFGTNVRMVVLEATAAFSLDDVNHDPSGQGAPTSYGVALWPLEGPPAATTCGDGASLRFWDARTHASAIAWGEQPAGLYQLWMWNEEGEGLSIEFNGAAANDDAQDGTFVVLNWTVTPLAPELADPAPAMASQTFSVPFSIAKRGFAAVEYGPPSGQPDAAASTEVKQGATCATGAGEGGNGFQQPDLRAVATLGPGDGSWDGAFTATLAPFGSFDGGAAVGVLVSEA